MGRGRALLAGLVGRLPPRPPSALAALLLNHGLRPWLEPKDVPELIGRHLCLEVTDLGLTLHLSATREAFVAADPARPADLTIRASAKDFLRLAAREEDPDTLFFQRRLVTEGDTGLGLALKNALDATRVPWWELLLALSALGRRFLPGVPRS